METPNIGQTRPIPTDDDTLSTSGVEETQAQTIAGDTLITPVIPASGGDDLPPSPPPSGVESKPSKRSPLWWGVVLLSILALFVIGLISAYGGYQSGINERTGYETTLTAQEAQQQYELGVQDIAEGRYEVARQRFEYVIQLNPNYPGVTGKLAEVLLEIRTTATPTTAPTPTLTPTVDLRGTEELFAQAQAFLINRECLYVTGVSFWELDWGQASYYFGQITLVAPNLRDSSNMTATERFRIATINYADSLGENGEWCRAEEQYQAVLSLVADSEVETKLNKAIKKCADDQAEENEDN